MKIIHTRLVDARGNLVPAAIHIQDGLITAVSQGEAQAGARRDVIDAQGWIASPGWIDLQVNGGFGLDFSTAPENVWEVAARLPAFGITAFLPTIITSPPETYTAAIAALKKGPPRGWRGAHPLGWHFEGPFLNPAKKGAHNPACLRLPHPALVQDWSRENGVWLVTMAPELPAAGETASRLLAAGVLLSAGHTLADISQARRMAENGFGAVTHLFNAMPPLDHRSPGIAAEALLNPRIVTGLIADGLHVHPAMVDLVWRLKGAEKVLLVSDAVCALGIPPGVFVQGGMEIVVSAESARLRDGTLAGSILRLDQALRNVMQFTGARLEQVLPALGANQARFLGLAQNGVLGPGQRADLTLVDAAGELKMTIVGGEVLYSQG